MYHTILFDLDGTLTDPVEGITGAVAYSLEQLGLPPVERAALISFIGPPLFDSYAQQFGLQPPQIRQAVTHFRHYFQTRGIYENKVLDGVPELLEQLHRAGKTIVLASSKPEAFCRQILERFDLLRWFDYVAGATMDERRVEKAEVIRYALDALHQTPDAQTIMVGDRMHDALGARAVGLDCIGVRYGYGSEEELRQAGCIHLVSEPAELLPLLLS